VASLKIDADPAEVGLDASRLQRVDTHFQRYIDDGRLAGWSVAVTRRGRVVHYSHAGVTDLDTWLGEPEEPQPHRQSVLFTKVVVALLSGRSAKHILDVQRARHLDTMKALTTARRNAATTQDALLADFQLFHLEADLRWIDHTESRLAALAEEVRDVPDPRRR